MDNPNAPDHIAALPVQLAIIEILELLMVSLSQLTNKKTKERGIKVKIFTPGTSGVQTLTWFQIEVLCLGTNELVVGLKDFLKDHGACMVRILTEMEKHFPGTFFTALLPMNGGKETKCIKVKVLLDGKYGSLLNEIVDETKEERKGILFTIKVYQDLQRMLVECQGVYAYLHRLRLLSPEYEFQFNLKISGSNSKCDFWNGGSRASFGPRRVAADIRHYMESPEEPDVKVQWKSGTSYTLVGVRVWHTMVSLKVSAFACIVPPLETESCSCNHICTQLKIFLYGPNQIPLLLPGVGQTGLSPTTLIKLSDYGLLLDSSVNKDHELEKGTVQGDWHYRLQNAEMPSEAQVERDADRNDTECVLHVVIMLETVKQDTKDSNVFTRLDGIRQNLAQILCKQRMKVRRATSTALNKVLHNFSQQDQVSDSGEFNHKLKNKLWRIAAAKYEVTKPLASSTKENENTMDERHVRKTAETSSHSPDGPVTKPVSVGHNVTSSPPMDFFDFLTRHRSPPLNPCAPSHTVTGADMEVQENGGGTEIGAVAGAETAVVVGADLGELTITRMMTQEANNVNEAVVYIPDESLPYDQKVTAQIGDGDAANQAADCFDTLGLDIGFSPDLSLFNDNLLPSNESFPLEPNANFESTALSTANDKAEVAATNLTTISEDWFNDILYN